MKRFIAVVIVLLFLAGLVITTQAQEVSLVPTSIPEAAGRPDDNVSRTLGGIYRNGIGIVGSQDESQLFIKEFATQTNDPIAIIQADGTPVFGVEADGAIDTEAEINSASYLLVGNPTPAVIATLTAGDGVLKNDMEIQGDLDVAGTSELDGGVSVDDVFTVADATGNIGTTGTLNVSPGASTLAAVTITDTLGVTELSTLTGGASTPINVENFGLPTVLSVPITYTAAAGGTGVVATIPDGEIWYVHSVWIRVTESFDCTGDDATLDIGDGGNVDGFLDLADANLQSDYDSWVTGAPLGISSFKNDGNAGGLGDYAGGFWYLPSGADETIDWILDETSGETFTAGAATIYVFYTRIQ